MDLESWSTESIGQRDRFEFWRDVLTTVVGTDCINDRTSSHAAFTDGRLSRLIGPTVARLRFDSAGHRVVRRSADIARMGWDGYWIYREASAGAWFDIADTELTTTAGDVVIADADVPFSTRPLDRFAHEAWVFPRKLIDPYLPKLAGPLTLKFNVAQGRQALALDFFESLRNRIDALSDDDTDTAVDVLGRLVGIACGAALPEHPQAVREANLERAKRHIANHLADMALSPTQTSEAIGISVRTLHLAFEPTGTSFATYVTRRRLQRCRMALESGTPRSIADIAFACGFGSLATFYRAFVREYGMSPSDVRGAKPPSRLDPR